MLPNGWKEVKLGECFDIQLGKMLNESARKQEPQFPYIANVNVRWGALDLSTLSSMFFSEREKEKFALKKNDILMCEGGEIGRCVVLKEDVQDVYYQKACHRLRTKNNLCDPWYLYFYMSYIVKSAKIIGLVGESSIAHLPVEKVEKILLTLPPLAEQKKIAETLSVWDSAIEKMEKLVEKKEEERKINIWNLIANDNTKKVEIGRVSINKNQWNHKLVGHVLKIGHGKDYKSLSVGNVPVYGTGGYMTSVNEYLYDGETVCIGRKGTIDKPFYYCGKIWTVDTLFYTYDFENVLPKYIYYMFCTVPWKKFSEASGVPSLTSKIIENIEFNCPPLSEQQTIADLLSNFDKELSLLKQQLALYKKQKQGLMQKLLTGEWRV